MISKYKNASYCWIQVLHRNNKINESQRGYTQEGNRERPQRIARRPSSERFDSTTTHLPIHSSGHSFIVAINYVRICVNLVRVYKKLRLKILAKFTENHTNYFYVVRPFAFVCPLKLYEELLNQKQIDSNQTFIPQNTLINVDKNSYELILYFFTQTYLNNTIYFNLSINIFIRISVSTYFLPKSTT